MRKVVRRGALILLASLVVLPAAVLVVAGEPPATAAPAAKEPGAAAKGPEAPAPAKAAAPKEINPKAPCFNASCHADVPKKKQLHGPVAAGECITCHAPKGNLHQFTLAAKGDKLCLTCHDPIKKEKSFHKALEQGCTTCHDPHGGDDKALLAMAPVQLCGTCHDETLAKAKAKAAPARHSVVLAGKACLTCHKGHASKFPNLLAASPLDVCLSCHDKAIKVGERLLSNLKEEVTARKFVHSPIKDDRDCGVCHEPHGSKIAALLKMEYPATFYAPFDPKAYAMCLQCHEKTAFTEAQTKEATAFRNGTLNLHYLHVHKTPKGRTCRACHATHASDLPHEIRASVPYGQGGWSIPIRFAATQTGGSCASGCHVPRSYDREKAVPYD